MATVMQASDFSSSRSDFAGPLLAAAALLSSALYLSRNGLTGFFPSWNKASEAGFELSSGSNLADDRCIVKALENEDKNCLVLFGSQSGNAQEMAEKLAREARTRFSLRPLVAELDDHSYGNLHALPEGTVVFFVMASYGDGEPTDNAAEFFKLLTDEDSDASRELREKGLGNLEYAAFGLGNSNYQHYQAVIRTIDRQLQALGAKRLGPAGEADDGKGTTEEDFIDWKDAMWPEVSQAMGLSEQQDLEYEPTLTVTEMPNHQGHIFRGDYSDASLPGAATTDHHFVPITDAHMLSKGKDRSYLHVELDLDGSLLCYETGDHLGISPINPDSEVEAFLKVFGLWEKRNTVITVKATSDDQHLPFPSPTSFESAARFYMDICGPVSRQLVATLAKCVPDPHKKTMLGQLGQNKEKFLEQTAGKFLTLASFMTELFPKDPTIAVPFSVLAEGIPKLQPRYYSISSSSTLDNDRVTITLAIESFSVPNTARCFNGIATNFIVDLASKRYNDVIPRHQTQPIPYALPIDKASRTVALPALVRTSTFRLPSDLSAPVLMIGPGTGVAPFRGFVRERLAQRRQGKNIGPMTLLYGCRKASEDFLYYDEWKAYADELGDKFEMHTALSRETAQKTYVQDLLRQLEGQVAKIVRNNGSIYVCGDVRMGRGVSQVICEVLAAEEQVSLPEAEVLVSELRHSHRYQEDVW